MKVKADLDDSPPFFYKGDGDDGNQLNDQRKSEINIDDGGLSSSSPSQDGEAEDRKSNTSIT